MKILMLVKDLNIKTLNTGDKSARVTLESLNPGDIPELANLNNITEVWVEFQMTTSDFIDQDRQSH